MKYCNCILYMALGAAMVLVYQRYGREMVCLCDKAVKKEKEMIENGLDLE